MGIKVISGGPINNGPQPGQQFSTNPTDIPQPGQQFSVNQEGRAQVVPEDTLGESLGRYGLQFLAGPLESLIGGTLGLGEMGWNLSNYLSGNKIGSWEEFPLGFVNQRTFDQALSQATGGLQEPKTWGQQKLRNITGTTAQLANPSAGVRGLATAGARALASEVVGDITQELTKSPWAAALSRFVTNLATGTAGTRKDTIQKAEQAGQTFDKITQNATMQTDDFVRDLQNYRKQVERSDTPSKKWILERIDSALNSVSSDLNRVEAAHELGIRRGSPSIIGKEIPASKIISTPHLKEIPIPRQKVPVSEMRALSSSLGKWYESPDLPKGADAVKALDKIYGIIKTNTEKSIRGIPKAKELLDFYDNVTTGILKQSGITRFLEKATNLETDLNSSIAKGLLFGGTATGGLSFGKKGAATVAGSALVAKEIAKTIDFLRNSELGRKAYIDAVTAGAARNARAATAASLRLDKIAQQWERRRNAELSKSKVGTVKRR